MMKKIYILIMFALAISACGGTTTNYKAPAKSSSCPSGTLALTSEAKCYTTSDSSNGEYIEVYPKGAIVISTGKCTSKYVQIKTGKCWIHRLAVVELD